MNILTNTHRTKQKACLMSPDGASMSKKWVEVAAVVKEWKNKRVGQSKERGGCINTRHRSSKSKDKSFPHFMDTFPPLSTDPTGKDELSGGRYNPVHMGKLDQGVLSLWSCLCVCGHAIRFRCKKDSDWLRSMWLPPGKMGLCSDIISTDGGREGCWCSVHICLPHKRLQ